MTVRPIEETAEEDEATRRNRVWREQRRAERRGEPIPIPVDHAEKRARGKEKGRARASSRTT